jgi:hypothetical protein
MPQALTYAAVVAGYHFKRFAMAHTAQNASANSSLSGLRINARIGRSLLVATCFMVCGSAAWSQSRQYQRGYDAGYQAGINSVQQGDHRDGRRDERHDGGNRDAHIRVLDAQYGRGNRVCNAAPVVQRFVDQRGEGTFQVSNDLCGDPAPNETKTLNVTYQCDRENPMRIAANEGNPLRISCH